MKKLNILLSMAVLAIATSCADSAVTTSPDGALSTTVGNIEGKLTVAMSYDGSPIMNNTPIQLTIDGECIAWEILSSKSEKKSDHVVMPTGEFDEKVVNFTESEYALEGVMKSGEIIDGALLVRSYDKGMAYRVVVNRAGEYTIVENSPYLFSDKGGFMNPNGEHEPLGPSSPAEVGAEELTTPSLYDAGKGYVLALHESDLHNYPQLRLTEDKANNSIKVANLEAIVEGEFKLPWRTVMYGTDIADIHNNKVILQTFNKPAEGDFSWVKPGLSMWDFRALGLTYDGLTYKVDTPTMKAFIDFASKNSVEYLMIDGGWYYETRDPLKSIPTIDIPEVISYANSKKIGIILYYDLGYQKNDKSKFIDFDTIAKTYAAWGAKGIKYGFLGGANGSELDRLYTQQEKVRVTEEVVATAAKHKLLIDFHDNPVPFSGLERTYPNYITREFCHAQYDRRTAFYPGACVKTLCVNLLSGSIDQTNGTYAINQMACRNFGPRNEYYSTVAAETARVVFNHTGHLTLLVDGPGAYEEKSDLFQILSELPAKWDETRYLDMVFDSHVTVARRSGNDWFTATVYNEAGGNSELKLCFLDPSRKYKATIYRDAADTHYQTNSESYEVESREVTSKDSIKVKVAPGGGYSVSFKAI